MKDPAVDQFVSGGILSSGAWEPGIVTKVMRALDTYPGAAFLDIGANIGEYEECQGGMLITNAFLMNLIKVGSVYLKLLTLGEKYFVYAS